MYAKGGEVRRVHIIYFLSSMGSVEQPHLIRVHHLARNGVYLRDVKRWLGELRGKDLPEAFAWSYKRRYKTGYVWQDLLDDDLITPISDNEYVLKGSQIHTTPFETRLLGEKMAEEKSPQVQVADGKQQLQPSLTEEPQIQRYRDLKTIAEEKLLSEITQESVIFSSDRSTMTDENDSSKAEQEKLVGTGKQNLDEQSHEKFENYSLHSLYHSLLLNKKRKNQSNKDNMNKTATPDTSFSSSSSSSQSPIKERKSFSTGASSVFRNWIACGAVDTNDKVQVMMNRADKILSKNSNKPDNKAEICKDDKLGGSARNFGSSWSLQQQEQYGARRSYDEKGANKNKKMLGDLIYQTPQKPFGGPSWL